MWRLRLLKIFSEVLKHQGQLVMAEQKIAPICISIPGPWLQDQPNIPSFEFLWFWTSTGKNFCNFQKCHFWNFLKTMKGVGDDANSVFHEDQKFSKVSFLKFKENAHKMLVLMPIMIFKKIWKFSKVTLLKITKVLYYL